MSKSENDRWEALVAGLPSSAPRDPAAAWWDDLPSSLAPGPAPPAPGTETRPPPAEKWCFGLVECPEGDMPVLRQFRDAVALARHLGRLDGKDVVVWAFHGVFLPVTKGSPRLVVLPDGTAVTVPRVPGEEPQIVPDPHADRQEDGYLGPPEFLLGRDPEDDPSA